jgi:hypothetical protein
VDRGGCGQAQAWSLKCAPLSEAYYGATSYARRPWYARWPAIRGTEDIQITAVSSPERAKLVSTAPCSGAYKLLHTEDVTLILKPFGGITKAVLRRCVPITVD